MSHGMNGEVAVALHGAKRGQTKTEEIFAAWQMPRRCDMARETTTMRLRPRLGARGKARQRGPHDLIVRT